MDEEKIQEEIEIQPVEIHPEMYSTNLFGEEVSAREIASAFTLSTGAPTASESLSPQARGAFNIFALTDAMGARSKRDAWVLYQKALASGMVPEEVFYKLMWQLKTMLTVKRTKSVSETDMKPFPYNKAKGFLKNFKKVS